MTTYWVEFARPGEAFCRIGSDEGFADLDAASTFMRYQTKGEWRGVVRLVTDDGTVVESVSAGDDA